MTEKTTDIKEALEKIAELAYDKLESSDWATFKFLYEKLSKISQSETKSFECKLLGYSKDQLLSLAQIIDHTTSFQLRGLCNCCGRMKSTLNIRINKGSPQSRGFCQSCMNLIIIGFTGKSTPNQNEIIKAILEVAEQ